SQGSESTNADFPPKQEMGDNDAKGNSHSRRRLGNCYLNRASGGCLRTPAHSDEGPRGGKRAMARQQCVCCPPWHCTAVVLVAVVLVELRRRGDVVGDGWSLTCNILRKCSGTRLRVEARQW